MKGKVLFVNSKNPIVHGTIEGEDGKKYSFDNTGIRKGNFLKPGAVVEFEKSSGKKNKVKAVKIQLLREEMKQLPDEQKERILSLLENILSGREFVDCSAIPEKLRALGINYKEYANDFIGFIETWFSDGFEIKRKVAFEGKNYSAVIVKRVEEDDKKSEKQKESSLTKEEIIEKLQEYLTASDYWGLLTSEIFQNTPPYMIGSVGVELVLKALSGYLYGDAEGFRLSRFQKLLIDTERVMDLKVYKDNVAVMKDGTETALRPLTPDNFGGVFASIYNGKKNYNYTWTGLAERAWSAQNEMAFYLTCILLILSKKEKILEYYLEEAKKLNVLEQLPEFLRIWKEFSSEKEFILSVRIKRKLIGYCFDNNNILALTKCLDLFEQESLLETMELNQYLKKKKELSADAIMGFFHSEIKELEGGLK